MEQEIIKCEERFLQALRSIDINTVEDLMHDDLIYNAASGVVMTKQMDISDFKSANPVIETLECVERKIQTFDNVAVVSTLLYMKATFMGTHKVDGKSRFLRTWKKINGEWKIIAAASINL